MTPPSDADRIITAKQIFTRLIQTDPDFPGGHAGLAFTLAVGRGSGAFDDPEQQLTVARDAANRAIRTDGSYGFGHGAMAVIQALLQQPELACKEAERALELNPGDAATLFAAGFAYQLVRQPERATGPIEEALRLDPIEPRTPCLNTLAIVYLGCGKPERSLELFERSRHRDGPAPVVRELYTAVAHLMLGQEEAACAYIEKLPMPLRGARGMLARALGDECEPVMKKLRKLGLTEPTESGRP